MTHSNSVHTQSSTSSCNVLGMASNDEEMQHLTHQLSHEEVYNILKVWNKIVHLQIHALITQCKWNGVGQFLNYALCFGPIV